MKREDGFYWIGDKYDENKPMVVAYYELCQGKEETDGVWLFCGSHYMFTDEDLQKGNLVVVEKVKY